jgi:rSAM/selenodomain-associated transferase 2
MYKYSIIIPTLNEEKFLPLLLKQSEQFNEDFEIIIADGGSKDNTLKTADDFDVKICRGEKGKGLQLNNGAKCSSGKVLIFLHADTFLPADAFNVISEYMFISNVNIATFKMKFDTENFLMKIYSWFTKFDSIFTTFGDQVIVIRRSFFDELGGFADFPLFEDVELLRKARKETKVYKLPSYITTSGRRFVRNGIIKTQLLNGLYIMEYLLGVSPTKIYKKYFREKL